VPLDDGARHVRAFLVRGMVCGLVAGLLAFAFATIYGEPQIGHALVFEAQIQRASGVAADPEIYSRAVQSTVGLLTAVAAIAAADGGLFGLAFAMAYGRCGAVRPRVLGLLVAAAAFVTTVIVPAMKYPANPPSIGEAATIGHRTELYFSLIALSLVAMLLAIVVGRALAASVGSWNASLAGGGVFIVSIFLVQLLLPTVDETPARFSADVLWHFRVAGLETQAIIWATIGLLFGALTERDARRDVASSTRATGFGYSP